MNDNIPNKSCLKISFFAVILSMIGTLWIYYGSQMPSNWLLFLYLAIIVFFYFSVIHSISNSSKNLKHEDIFRVVCTYFLLNFSIIAWFAFAGISFNSFECDANCLSSNMNKLVDAFYYSTVSFTTIGFGDIVPINTAGKLLLIVEALISSVNSAMFISIVFLKFKK